MRFSILLCFLIAVPTAKGAVAHDATDLATLARNPTWLKLVKYQRTGGNGKESAVTDPEFFLAPDGRTNPVGELRATIRALSEPLGAEADEHAKCRYPARYLWLKSQSVFHDTDDIICPSFDNWIFGQQTDSISVVFVTGYLGNPASYYGHTLLKFNSSASREETELLDVSVNYGAIIPPGIGPLAYIYNGATGGFDAGFSHIEYYYHDYNYGELELRDLWEYELILEPAEVKLVMAHAWEVLGKAFTYYFFRRNCAYRMAELVEIVRGIEIIPGRRLWTVPQAVVRRLTETGNGSESLIAARKWRPSRQSVFYASFERLSKTERHALGSLVEDPESSRTGQLLREMPVDSQTRVVDTAMDYYAYRMPKHGNGDSELSRASRAVTALRFRLPKGNRVLLEQPSAGPERDRAPGYLSAGVVRFDARKTGARFRIRPAYYDVLDSSTSHVQDSELSMGDVIVDVRDGKVSVTRVGLFRVEAVNAAVSGLPGDSGRSWALALGATEQYPGCNSCLVARFEGDYGRSAPLWRDATIGFYAGGAIQDNRNDFGNLFGRAKAYINARWTANFRSSLRYELRYHVDSPRKTEDVFALDSRCKLSRNWDLRLELRKNVTRSASLTVGYYW